MLRERMPPYKPGSKAGAREAGRPAGRFYSGFVRIYRAMRASAQSALCAQGRKLLIVFVKLAGDGDGRRRRALLKGKTHFVCTLPTTAWPLWAWVQAGQTK